VTSRRKGKATERRVSRTLGGERHAYPGRKAEDISWGPFDIEVKQRSTYFDQLVRFWREAKAKCREGQEPALVLFLPHHKLSLFIFSLQQARDWLGVKIRGENLDDHR